MKTNKEIARLRNKIINLRNENKLNTGSDLENNLSQREIELFKSVIHQASKDPDFSIVYEWKLQ